MMSCTAQDARGAAEPLVIDEATAIGEVQYAGADGAAIWLTNEARRIAGIRVRLNMK